MKFKVEKISKFCKYKVNNSSVITISDTQIHEHSLDQTGIKELFMKGINKRLFELLPIQDC